MGTIEIIKLYKTLAKYMRDSAPKKKGDNMFNKEDYDTSKWVK